jgi:hypothetical protein
MFRRRGKGGGAAVADRHDPRTTLDLTRVDLPDPFLGDPELRGAYRALTSGDWSALERFLSDSSRAWMLRPILSGDVVDLEAVTVDRWVEHGGSHRAKVFKASIVVRDALRAWFATVRPEGEGAVEPDGGLMVEAEERFLSQIESAEDLLYEVVAGRPTLADPWEMLLVTGRCRGLSLETLRDRFDGAHTRSTFHPGACREYLQSLSKKWGGSTTASLDFARWIEAEAPPLSPTREALPTVHIERGIFEFGIDDLAEYLHQPDVVRELSDGLTRLLDGLPGRAPTELLPALNAYVLALTVDSPETAQLMGDALERVGDRFTEWPWSLYGDDVAAVFHQIRTEQMRFAGRY